MLENLNIRLNVIVDFWKGKKLNKNKTTQNTRNISAHTRMHAHTRTHNHARTPMNNIHVQEQEQKKIHKQRNGSR